MKRSLIALATLIAIPLSMSSATAGFGFGFGPGHGHGMRGGPNAEFMARALDLTPEQQEKVKAVFAEHAKKRDEMRSAMQADMQGKMQQILTKDQYAKMTDLRQARMGGPGPAMAPGMAGRGAGRGPGCTGLGPRW
jgi:Spy/CpxP family protein refolding chaperone